MLIYRHRIVTLLWHVRAGGIYMNKMVSIIYKASPAYIVTIYTLPFRCSFILYVLPLFSWILIFVHFINNILGKNKLFITDCSCLILFLNFLPNKILKTFVYNVLVLFYKALHNVSMVYSGY